MDRLKKPMLFLLTGGIAFIVDVSVLYILIEPLSVDPFIARIISILAAMLFGYAINRQFVFGKSGKTVQVELAQYMSVASLNALFSYAIYAGLILFVAGLNPLLATAIAVILVAVSSYMGYSRLVFKRI